MGVRFERRKLLSCTFLMNINFNRALREGKECGINTYRKRGQYPYLKKWISQACLVDFLVIRTVWKLSNISLTELLTNLKLCIHRFQEKRTITWYFGRFNLLTNWSLFHNGCFLSFLFHSFQKNKQLGQVTVYQTTLKSHQNKS